MKTVSEVESHFDALEKDLEDGQHYFNLP